MQWYLLYVIYNMVLPTPFEMPIVGKSYTKQAQKTQRKSRHPLISAHCYATITHKYTAASTKVVPQQHKSARDNTERYYG